jgi:hypothetical protein
MDGEIIDLAVLNASQNMGTNNIDYVSSFDAAEEPDEYYNARGRSRTRSSSSRRRRPSSKRSSSSKRGGGNFGQKVGNLLDRFGFSQKGLEQKNALQMEQAKSASQLAQSAGAGDSDIAALLASSAAPIVPAKQPMSKGLKIGLIAGGIGVVVIAGILIFKSMGSSGKATKK